MQPASVDLRLGNSFRVFHNHRTSAIDLRDPPTNLTEHVAVEEGAPFVIHPGEFVLGVTEEHVALPDDVVARAVRMVVERRVTAADGTELEVEVASLCVHGDTPGAAELARAVRAGLEAAGVALRPFA